MSRRMSAEHGLEVLQSGRQMYPRYDERTCKSRQIKSGPKLEDMRRKALNDCWPVVVESILNFVEQG